MQLGKNSLQGISAWLRMGNSNKKQYRAVADRGQFVLQGDSDHLFDIDPDSIPAVPFQDLPIMIRIYDVHDGDTVSFIFMYGSAPMRLRLRLIGVDTPEVRAGDGHLKEEKAAGMTARRRLIELIGGVENGAGRVLVPTLTHAILRGWDKYGGRVLGELMTQNGKSISDLLISEGYGKRYDGGGKTPWVMSDFESAPFAK